MDIIKDPELAAAAHRSWRQHIAQARRSRAALVIFAIAGAVAVAGGYLGWRTWVNPAQEAAAYSTAVAQRGDLEDTVTATGTLQPRDYVDVGTQVSGQIRKLAVEIGSTVKRGQLLAEIDPTVYQTRVDADQAQLLNLRAQLADRQAQLKLAEQQFQRQSNLMREQATTTDAMQTAEAGLDSARAQIDVLKAQIQQTSSTLRGDQANLGYTRIYAPMSGTVVSQNAKPGQTLNANQQAPIVLRIADLSTMTVQSQVSEADVSRLRVGMDVYFTTLGSGGKRWYGKLRQINPTPETVNNVVLYNALFDVANSDGALMTQMTAQIFFVTVAAKDAVTVPLAALRKAGARSGETRRGGPGAKSNGRTTDKGATSRPQPSESQSADPRTEFAGGRAVVHVVKKDGTTEAREVSVGVMNRVSAQIVSGLEPGETVVVGRRSAAPARAQAATPSTPRMRSPF